MKPRKQTFYLPTAASKQEEVCRKAGISEATYYLWKRRYWGVGVSDRRLKRLVVDLSMDRQIPQEIVSNKL